LKDAYAVFLVTNWAISMSTATETQQGKNVADIVKVSVSIAIGGVALFPSLIYAGTGRETSYLECSTKPLEE